MENQTKQYSSLRSLIHDNFNASKKQLQAASSVEHLGDSPA